MWEPALQTTVELGTTAALESVTMTEKDFFDSPVADPDYLPVESIDPAIQARRDMARRAASPEAKRRRRWAYGFLLVVSVVGLGELAVLLS